MQRIEKTRGKGDKMLIAFTIALCVAAAVFFASRTYRLLEERESLIQDYNDFVERVGFQLTSHDAERAVRLCRKTYEEGALWLASITEELIFAKYDERRANSVLIRLETSCQKTAVSVRRPNLRAFLVGAVWVVLSMFILYFDKMRTGWIVAPVTLTHLFWLATLYFNRIQKQLMSKYLNKLPITAHKIYEMIIRHLGTAVYHLPEYR